MVPEEKINCLLNKFLAQFDCKAKLGMDFAYYYSKSLITYSFVITKLDDETYLEFVKSLAPDITIDIFLISFLHELGHHMTIDDIEEGIELYCQDEKAIMSAQLSGLKEEDRESIVRLYNRYYNLPDEYAATMWAINYIRKNEYAIKELWIELQKEIIDFYKNF